MIVSTHTISLQEQIEHNDLPLCRRLFESVPELTPYSKFRSTLLLGKSNYLCPSRLAHALADRATLFADADFDELQRIAGWAAHTATGLRHELQPPPRHEIWEAVCADSAGCSRKHCSAEHCFYQRAKARLRSAQVIVVNHALLFALLHAGGAQAISSESRGVLFPDDFVVLDEAHTVSEVATDHFGLSLSSYGVERALKHLYNPKTRRGILVRRHDSKGSQLVVDALDASTQFFGFLADRILDRQPIVRIREPNPAEPVLDAPLGALERHLGKLADKLEDGRERDEMLEQRQRVRGLQATIAEWLAVADPGQVHWAERGGRRRVIITLRAAPLDVAPALRNHLFTRRTAVVCTSATLALAGEIGPFVARIGAEAARTGIVASPFDFERNMRVYVAADVPLPSPRDASLSTEALVDYVGYCTERVGGGSLVLFTSYSDMRAVAAALEPRYREMGRPLLVQGEALSRSELARQMRKEGNAVLFGTDSFWTGVDIPGNALAQVIITRLPFDPPTHPVTEARAEWIRDQGGNPFNELTLPDALMKFRQGAGRLIRSRTDRGLVTILDSRVIAKTYGRLFLGSLPQTIHERITRESREEAFHPFS
jgi:ATP-dependent DNA helicase DinG